MGIEAPPAALPAAISITSDQAGDLDQRWAAWQAKGAAHERAFRRKMVVVLPVLIIVAAVVAYVMLGR